MSMLNTHIDEIKANRRLSLSKTPTGSVFSLGKDFRIISPGSRNNDNRDFGIPRPLFDSNIVIDQIALGRDHAVLLSERGQVYTYGSNQYG